MKNRDRAVIAVPFIVLTGVVLGLAACGAPPQSREEGWTNISEYNEYVKTVEVLVDGDPVTCVVYDGNNAGGISCDWSDEE